MKKIALVVFIAFVCCFVFLASTGEAKRGEERLLSITNVDLSEDGETVLFTVPRGFRCILTKAVLVVGSNAGMTYVSIGQDGAETDFLLSQTLRPLNTQDDATIFFSNASSTVQQQKSYTSEAKIKIFISGTEGGNKNTLFLYGILY